MTWIKDMKMLIRDIMNRPPSVLRIAIKLGLILFGISFWVTLYLLVWDEATGVDDMADRLRGCDDDYYEKDIEGLRQQLNTFDLTDEVFDKHWEIANGYTDYLQYVQYEKAVEAGHEDSRERLQMYQQKLQDNVNNCQFEENRELLQEYADVITQ